MSPDRDGSPFEQGKTDLGLRLRALRRKAKLTGTGLADQFGWSQSKISKIETGRVAPTVEDMGKILDALGATAEERAALMTQAEALQTEASGWGIVLWEGLARGQETVSEREQTSKVVRVFSPTIIPGLLQSGEYARNIFSRFSHDPPDQKEVVEAVAARVQRQAQLYEREREYYFLILETALYNRFGSAQVMQVQIQNLVSFLTLENVSLAIFPRTSDLPHVPMHPFSIFDHELATVETMPVHVRVRSPLSLDYFRTVFESLWKGAEVGDGARAILMDVADWYGRSDGRS